MLDLIPVSTQSSWQECLSNCLTDPTELLSILQLNSKQIGFSSQASEDFSLRVPRPYLSRIVAGDPQDPLLLQVLPTKAETQLFAGFGHDPLNEQNANPSPGLLHKYQGRALLLPTSSCAIHCRYCFRRHFPYEDNRPSKLQWQQSLQYLSDDSSISEVILSGGDPLTCSDKHLSWLVNELNQIPHLRRLRLHTRLPIMIPQRITQGLCQILSKQDLQVIVVLHSNHAQEFDSEVDKACRQLRNSGATLLNQSVLLKGINDTAQVLIDLSNRLFDTGILPYYLHVLDKVSGAGHFDIPTSEALRLLQETQQLLPGYLVPKLVRENAGEGSKTLVF